MDVIINLKKLIIDAIKNLGLDLVLNDVIIENSKNPEHGDYATNVALKYAKSLSLKPIDLANKMDVKNKILMARLRGETVEEISENLGMNVEYVQKVLDLIK